MSMELFAKTLSAEYQDVGVFKACSLQSKDDFPGKFNNHDITILTHSYKYCGYDLPQVEKDILENNKVYKRFVNILRILYHIRGN